MKRNKTMSKRKKKNNMPSWLSLAYWIGPREPGGRSKSNVSMTMQQAVLPANNILLIESREACMLEEREEAKWSTREYIPYVNTPNMRNPDKN